MKKRITAILLLTCLLLGVLVGCKEEEEAVSSEKAQQIVIEHLGAEERDVSNVHVHIEENDAGEVCYSVHITVKGKTYTCVVHGVTGEVLSVIEGSSH